NQEQAAKLAATRTDLPSDVQVVSYDPCSQEVAGTEILLLDQLVETIPRALDDLLAASVQSDSLATILYTSGTTGDPKGVMLTQENLVSNAAGTLESFGQEPGDVRLGFLPLSHIFARTCDLYTWLFGGTELALAESRDTVLADCAEIQPMLLNAVPYFYDKLYRSLQDQGLLETPGILRKLLGGRIRSCCSGGAALPNNVFDFFLGQEVPLYQGYGLTEASPVITVSSTEQVKRGSVGKPLKDVEVQLADDGEIITRGAHVMAGYYGNLAATQEVVQDGWLYTGDLGSLDEEGFLFITGRKKEIIVTLGGKNIAPVLLESLLLEDPLIEQVMVIGSERKFLVALIYPGLTALSREMGEATMTPLDASGLATDARVLRLFEERIGDRLADLSPYEQIGQFVLIDRPFSQEFNELTPKLSLRRAEVEENFSQQIEAMYQATRRQ
ncbi:MAG: AMP-binding protein, partial [Planctomycetaceae bacterium]|nr:AMP-binding protein [Planctomycetaceae bacterium]